MPERKVAMEALSGRVTEIREAARLLRHRRRSFSNWFVVAIYALMVVCAPFALRYGPDQATSVIAATAAAPRCATAPEFGYSCKAAAVGQAASR